MQNNKMPGKAYWIILFTTIALLVALIIAFVVVMCIGEGGNEVEVPTGNSPTGITKKTNKKTVITLPCITEGGAYLSTSASGVATIEGIKSECAVLVDISSNKSVAEKGADVVIHPASMTKVMTLLVACENAKNPNALLTVKEEMLQRRAELEGSGELVENTTALNGEGDPEQIDIIGKSVTVADALYLINYQSDTVACLLIANYVAGSEADFVKLMNDKAAELGLSKTKFVNSTGLTEKSGDYNTTTCREMAAIMAAAIDNPMVKKIVTGTEKFKADIYEGKTKTEYVIPFFADWHNKANRLNGDIWAGKVKLLGGKTGYEDIPTSCFVTYGIHSGSNKAYVCVIVGKTIGSNAEVVYPEPQTKDTRLIYANYAK